MNTLLITVDALRADHLGQYGYDRETVPALDRLESDGTKFLSAYSNGPYTRISVPSIHSSRYLAYDRLEEYPTIASILRDEGLYTACIGTQTGFANYTGDLVFDEFKDFGMDDFKDRANKPKTVKEKAARPVHSLARDHIGPRIRSISMPVYARLKEIYKTVVPGTGFRNLSYTSAEDVTDAATKWLKEHEDEDFFLWIHYEEGHRPYGIHDTRHEFVNQPVTEKLIQQLMTAAGTNPDEVMISDHNLIQDLYDSNLRYCSRHMSRLFGELEELGLWSETNIVLTSDHGEEFYEHGYYFHRNLPYDELLNVPLFVKTTEESEDIVGEQRQLLDVAPTICKLHGIDTSALPFLGQSLFEDGKRKIIAVGAQLPKQQVVAGRWDGWKYIATEHEELLFNLDQDPREQWSVAEDYPEVLERFREEIPDPVFTNSPEELSEPDEAAARQRLEALGYLEIERQRE